MRPGSGFVPPVLPAQGRAREAAGPRRGPAGVLLTWGGIPAASPCPPPALRGSEPARPQRGLCWGLTGGTARVAPLGAGGCPGCFLGQKLPWVQKGRLPSPQCCSPPCSCRCWLISNRVFAHCPCRGCTSPAGLQPSGSARSFHGKILAWCGASSAGGAGQQISRRPWPARLALRPRSVPTCVAGCSSKNTFQ